MNCVACRDLLLVPKVLPCTELSEHWRQSPIQTWEPPTLEQAGDHYVRTATMDTSSESRLSDVQGPGRQCRRE
jgi:hypothetical protein